MKSNDDREREIEREGEKENPQFLDYVTVCVYAYGYVNFMRACINITAIQ